MNRLAQTRRQARGQQSDQGFTLVEMVVAVVLLGGITAAVLATLFASMRSSQESARRVTESNDAQIISAWLVRDAQAAGGSNPATGAVDITLGVSLSDAAGCAAPGGTLVARFRWIDRTTTTPVAKVSTYSRTGNTLVRNLCTDGGAAATAVLGRQVATAVAVCSPVGNCPGMPTSVALTVTEANGPSTAETTYTYTPYTYTLNASLRPEAQTPPAVSNGMRAPLLALGTPTCSGVTGLSVGGSSDVTVLAGAVSNCPINVDNGFHPVSMAAPNCPASGLNPDGSPCVLLPAQVPDPFAGLPLPPGGGTCGDGLPANPARGSGVRWPAGVYRDRVTLDGGTHEFSGIYVFCAGIRVGSQANVIGTDVLWYNAGGQIRVNGGGGLQMAAATSGPWARVLVWQPASNTNEVQINGGSGTDSYNGYIYVPGANVSLSGNAGYTVASIISRTMTFTGNNTTVIG